MMNDDYVDVFNEVCKLSSYLSEDEEDHYCKDCRYFDSEDDIDNRPWCLLLNRRTSAYKSCSRYEERWE